MVPVLGLQWGGLKSLPHLPHSLCPCGARGIEVMPSEPQYAGKYCPPPRPKWERRSQLWMVGGW